MRLAALTSDLMLFSRIEAAAAGARVPLTWLRSPVELPPAADLDLLLVDWSERAPSWTGQLVAWRGDGGARLILFGPHTDLEAHAAARAAGLGPMWARSRLFRELPRILSGRA